MASRIAEAYVQIVPRIDGIGSSLTKGLSSEMGQTGEAAGGSFKTKFMGVTKNIAGPLVAAFGAAAVIGFAKQGVSAAAAFDKGLREVVTLTGATGAEAEAQFQGFSDSVKGLSADLALTTDTLTTGLYNAISAGVPTDNVFSFLEIAGKAAIGGVTDVNTAVDGLTTVLNAFGLQATEATAVSDSLFAAVQGGKTTFGELSDSLFNIGPAAAAAGVSFQEVNAAIATLTASGVPTSVATTQLRAALTGLQRPSKELDAIFQALGFQSAQIAIEQKGLGFALGAVKDASGGSNGALQQLLGSVEAVGAANVIAGTGAEKFTAEMERQANALGATNLAYEEISKSTQFESLQNSLNLLQLEIGSALLPVMVDLANVFSQSILPAIITVFTFLKENNFIIYSVAAALGVMALAWLGMTIAASPWLLIGAAIAASVGVIIAIVMNWGKITEAVKNGINAAMNFLRGVFTGFAKFFSNTWNGVLDFFKKLPDTIKGFFSNAGTWLMQVGKDIINGLLNGLKSMWSNVTGFFSNLGTNVANSFKAILGIRSPSTVFYRFGENIVDGLVGGVMNVSGTYEQAMEKLGKIGANTFVATTTGAMLDLTSFLGSYSAAWNEDASKGQVSAGNAIRAVMGSSSLQGTLDKLTGGVTFGKGNKQISFGGDLTSPFIQEEIARLTAAGYKMERQPKESAAELIEKLGQIAVPKVRKPKNRRKMAKGGYVDGPTNALIGEYGPEVVVPLNKFEKWMGLEESSGKVINYYAAENKSIDSEQALIQAIKRAKVVTAW